MHERSTFAIIFLLALAFANSYAPPTSMNRVPSASTVRKPRQPSLLAGAGREIPLDLSSSSLPKPPKFRALGPISPSRRLLFTGALSALALCASPAPSHATYSAYSNREKDWETRQSQKSIKVSTASDLRRQLREIAPENEKQEKFCPNGPSSAVSPLMENRCGDRLATASVFGRTEDVVGNSIPGFDKGYVAGAGKGVGGASNLSAQVGGFPAYGKISK